MRPQVTQSGASVPLNVPKTQKDAASVIALPRPDAGAPGRTRTTGTWFRKPLLYPPELRGLAALL